MSCVCVTGLKYSAGFASAAYDLFDYMQRILARSFLHWLKQLSIALKRFSFKRSSADILLA
jgi:hypothetical protein